MALIKCSECGHEISDKAESCPNCGCPVKGKEETTVASETMEEAHPQSDSVNDNDKSMKWPLCVVACIMLVVGLAILLNPSKSGNGQVNAFADADTLSVLDTIAGSHTDDYAGEEVKLEYNGKPKKIGNWYYGATKDPMTDKVSYMAINLSTNKSVVCGESTNLSIYLHYGESGLVGLGLQKGMFRTEKLPLAYIRFDDGKIETYNVRADTPQNIYLMVYDKFVRKLKMSKKVAVKIECADYSTATFTFNTEGLKWNYGNTTDDEIDTNQGREDNVDDNSLNAFDANGAYTATERQMRGMDGELECTVTHTVKCYSDGTATWKETCQGAVNVTEIFEGEMKHNTKSYHDRVYVWYEYYGYCKETNSRVDRLIDTKGNVYNGTKFEHLINGHAVLNLARTR